jgi:hypothetical protein
MRPRVPVMFAHACMTTECEEMEERFAAAQIFLPGDMGRVQLEGTVKLKLY